MTEAYKYLDQLQHAIAIQVIRFPNGDTKLRAENGSLLAENADAIQELQAGRDVTVQRQHDNVVVLAETIKGIQSPGDDGSMNRIRVTRLPKGSQTPTTILIPLPRTAWRVINGGCACVRCKGKPASYWDTVAVSIKAEKEPHRDTTWMVHAPELHTDK